MSSVSGSSSVNGLYTNANSISGLVSGLDTESMIENLVDSYNMKIISYQRDIVMQEWKQEAYRDVINDLLALSSNYMDLTNQTSNLSSNSYWNSAYTTVAEGENASAVSVSGSTDSTVTIDSVLQVATAERVVSTALSESSDSTTIVGGTMSLGDDDTTTSSLVTGSLGLTYGSTKVSLSFSSSDEWDLPDDASEDEIGQALADMINSKLADATIGGEPANSKMVAVYDSESGELSFKDLSGAGNSVWVSSASSSLKSAFGIDTSSYQYDEDAATITFSGVTASDLQETKSNMEVVQGATMTFNYNGNSVKVTIPDEDDDIWNQYDTPEEAIKATIEEQLQDAFGDSVKVTQDASGALTFTMGDAGTNTLTITSDINEILGLGSGTATSYISSSDTLGDVLGMTFPSAGNVIEGDALKDGIDVSETGVTLGENQAYIQAVGSATYNSYTNSYTDSQGDTIVKVTGAGEDGEDIWVKLNDDGEIRVGEEISINGEVVGVFDESNTISDVVSAINSSDAGVTASFSTLTNNFVLTANDTGSSSKVIVDNTALGAALLGTTYQYSDTGELLEDEEGNALLNTDQHSVTDGQDCIMLATVNGESITLVRASNTVEIEGLKVTANSTFNNTVDGVALTAEDLANADLEAIRNDLEITDEITFGVETDFDPIVELVQQMVDDYNELMNKVKTYFTEVPLSGEYLPLTDDDSSTMTESAVAAYEEKAKTGLLFGVTNMRSLYTSMSSIFSASGPFGVDLANMGFSVGYGVTASGDLLDFDETKFREMLETDFDTVRSAFTSTAASTGSSGVMESMKSVVNTYAAVTGVDKGILVNAAGSEHSSLSLLSNTMQDKIDAWTTLIAAWEEKLESKIDYYTAQFTKLEVLMSEMNSQSSALADLGT